MSNIISLTSENVKRLSVVHITPNGNMVVVGGKNAQGKSSVLDSILYALGGVKEAAEEPIRRGEESAKIVIELDELTITRKFTPSGSTLEVKNKEGLRYPSPQAVLDKLCGAVSFNPLAFVTCKPADQLTILRELTGLDTTQIDASRKDLFEMRTSVNRQVKEQEAVVKSLPESGPEEVSVSDLLAQVDEINAHNKTVDAAARKAEELFSQFDAAQRSMVRAQQAVDDAEAALKKAKDWLETLTTQKNDVANQKEAADKAYEAMERKDATELRGQIAQAEETNRAAAKVRQRAEEQAKLDIFSKRADDLTAQIEELDQKKTEMVAAVKFPVEGLAFDETGVTYNGFPLAQSSSAEKLRVGLAVAIAMNPTLKVMLIRDGSLLDEDGLALVAKIAEENGAQVWIERVGKGGECTVVIEDGFVAGAPKPEPKPKAEKPAKPKDAPAHDPAPQGGVFADMGLGKAPAVPDVKPKPAAKKTGLKRRTEEDLSLEE